MTPVFFLVGYPQNGKSTVRHQICQRLGMTGASTSDFLYSELARLWGVSEGELRKVPKEILRPQLVTLGDLITARDPGRLVYLTAAHGARVIDGVRRLAEHQAGKRTLEQAGHQVVTVLVTRSDFPIIPDNTDPRVFEKADHYLTAETVDDLEQKTDLLLAALGLG